MLGKECGWLDGEHYNNKVEPIQTTKSYRYKKSDKQIQKAKNQMPKNENKEIQSQQTYNAWQGVWLAGWRAL